MVRPVLLIFKVSKAGWRTLLSMGTGMNKILPGVCICLFFIAEGVFAETIHPENTLGLMAAELPWLAQATQISTKLDHESGLRILPILGAGGVQALHDLAELPNVDAAIVSSDTLAYATAQKLLGTDENKFSYVARLGALDVVLVARRGIANVTALAGKRIATGPAQSAAFATGEVVLGGLEIPFTRVPLQGDAAIDALLNGKADAVLLLGTEVSTAAISDGRFHVLTLPLPPQLNGIYQPAIVTAHDLPGLIPQKETIETLAAALTLAVHDHARDAGHNMALKNFETMLFKLNDENSGSNIAADIPGWKRHAAAQDILNQARAANADLSIITPTGGKP